VVALLVEEHEKQIRKKARERGRTSFQGRRVGKLHLPWEGMMRSLPATVRVREIWKLGWRFM